MAAPQISTVSTAQLLKDGYEVNGTVVQPGFKLPDVVITAVGVQNMDDLGDW